MKISDKGVELIKSFEGCRLKAYLCPAGVWTIGYGHTSGVYQGMEITQEAADNYLLEDLAKFEAIVSAWDHKYHWTQGEYDALVSFTYNCGGGNLKKLLQNGIRTKTQIAEAFKLYNKASGRVLAGLVRRRGAERALFLSDADLDVRYYPQYKGNSDKIDIVFNEIGADQDYDMAKDKPYQRRAPIAKANGISRYTGSAKQNLSLIAKAKSGELKRI